MTPKILGMRRPRQPCRQTFSRSLPTQGQRPDGRFGHSSAFPVSPCSTAFRGGSETLPENSLPLKLIREGLQKRVKATEWLEFVSESAEEGRCPGPGENRREPGRKLSCRLCLRSRAWLLSAHLFPFPVEVRKWEGALALDFWPRSSLIASRWSPLHVVRVQ